MEQNACRHGQKKMKKGIMGRTMQLTERASSWEKLGRTDIAAPCIAPLTDASAKYCCASLSISRTTRADCQNFVQGENGDAENRHPGLGSAVLACLSPRRTLESAGTNALKSFVAVECSALRHLTGNLSAPWLLFSHFVPWA